jgi:ribosomal protein L37AE/L43A
VNSPKCPVCRELTATKLDVGPIVTAVDYWRCHACGHTWTTDRLTKDFIAHVTPLNRFAGMAIRSGRMLSVQGWD